jgi:hypothetical protein
MAYFPRPAAGAFFSFADSSDEMKIPSSLRFFSGIASGQPFSLLSAPSFVTRGKGRLLRRCVPQHDVAQIVVFLNTGIVKTGSRFRTVGLRWPIGRRSFSANDYWRLGSFRKQMILQCDEARVLLRDRCMTYHGRRAGFRDSLVVNFDSESERVSRSLRVLSAEEKNETTSLPLEDRYQVFLFVFLRRESTMH